MNETVTRTRRRVVIDQRALALAIGGRIRAARRQAGLTQQELAGERYTKAYISALELGHAKPSMAALDYLAPRLGTTPDRLLADPALRWSRLDADLALAAGRFAEAAEAYEGILATESDPIRRAEILFGLGEARARLGMPDAAAGPLSEAHQSFSRAGRTSEAKRAQYWLSWIHLAAGDADEARRLLRELLGATPESADDPDLEVRVRIALAQVENRNGDPSKALVYLEEAREPASQLDLRRRAVFYDSLARTRQAVGDLEAAIRAGLEALTLFRALEADYDEANLENEMAIAFLALGNTARAGELAGHSRTVAERTGQHHLLGFVDDTLASIALERGDPAAALTYAEEALAVEAEHGPVDEQLGARVTRARALAALGRTEEADRAWTEAVEAARRQALPGRRRKVLTARADALAAEGRHVEAYEVMREAM